MDTTPKSTPTVQEMEQILGHSERCLKCKSAFTPDGADCYEFTPGGVETCANLPWWNGKPILPETLRQWKEIVVAYQSVPHRADD